ncbi:MAG: hypothetical protein MAG581_01750 [Deltaproteobacteria bacterium]|nr:hypothetical protein [Deltaproteobacteria bacterium]
MISRALGADNYPFIVISHPISSASKAELTIQAINALDEGVNLLLKSNRSTES